MVDYLPSKQEIWVRFPLSANFFKVDHILILISSLGEMVNTADLKSAPLRVIGSIPIVSRVNHDKISKRFLRFYKICVKDSLDFEMKFLNI